MKNQRKDPDRKWIGAGLFAALAASLCCIIPVAAFLAGIGGIGAIFSWMEPFRPYLIGFAGMLLGFAWYLKLEPHWNPECECKNDPSFWQSKSFLGIVTVFSILLLAFPYYSDAFFQKQEKHTVNLHQKKVQSMYVEIKGMTCTGCETTVEQAAVNVDGVLEADASYDTGTATIKYDYSKTDAKQITAAINETGFTVTGKMNTPN